MPIIEDVHTQSVGELVTLFQLDATVLGGAQYYFTEAVYESSVVVFAGNTYTPMAVKSEGFEVNANGSQPRPTLTVSNINKIFLAGVLSLNGLLGSTIYRRRTLRKYLDTQASADSTQVLSTEIYTVNQVKSFDKSEITWELTSILDQDGQKLPKRQILKTSCSHTYRYWNGTAFVYTNATCPYVGATSFDKNDNVTTDANDTCSKSVASCKIRFGANADLPTRSFPGTARFKGR